jgi:glycogen phosphorylase
MNVMSETLYTIYLARQGETAWSILGQHTGLADLPLTERGPRNATRLRERPKGLTFAKIFMSPLQRAGTTCELAGFGATAQSDRDLVEWDYGQYEARRTSEIHLERLLANNITNLLLGPIAKQIAVDKKLDWLGLLEEEPDAGLGNGGLGRLAACFLDSMATLQLPGMGYGLRYEYGMFKQSIKDGWQQEQPDNWLRRPDPWEVPRPEEKVDIKLNCSFQVREGSLRAIEGRPSTLFGLPFDRPIVGYGGSTINTLRLWSAAAPDYFDFREFSQGDFVAAIAETLEAESLTRVLYPDDSTSQGQALRFVQEYFLVACSLADIVRRFRVSGTDWTAFPGKIAIQLNDTHPTMAVPELMRILLDEAHLGWDQAWEVTQKTLGYTNHTLLPEALEKWPVAWFERVLPRHLEIIFEINRRLLDDVRLRFPGDSQRVANVSLIEEGREKHVRMANLAIVGSHSTNGVAAIHSNLLRTTTVKDLAEVFPERFNNKTNGVTPRRWLRLANPALADSITEAIGDDWITDLSELHKLKPFADDAGFRDSILKAKREAKSQFAIWLKSTSGEVVDPETIFDSQIKRIHEYKRQLLNALRIVVLYNRLRDNPSIDMAPRTFFFGGKAAPAYHLAKLIIKFVNNLAGTIDGDPAMRGRLNVLFLPEYAVSLAERLIPASDVSNQISTAGYEAGEENFFLFGLRAQQVADSRCWYTPYWHYDHEAETRAALDLIFSNHFSRYEPGVFEPLRDTLLTHGDHYMHLADLKSYLDADQRLLALYADPQGWVRKAILNVAASGKFSSDRTISQYASEIWGVKVCPVD